MPTDKTRFTFWLREETLAELARFQDATGKESVAEAVRTAIRVYLDLLKAADENIDLIYRDRDTGEEGRIWLLPGPFPFKKGQASEK